MLSAESVWPSLRRGLGGRVQRPDDAGSSGSPACWRFAHVRFDEAQAKLSVHDVDVALERSSGALLSHLLRHAGEVVHKDALLEVGWSGRIVAENTLAKAISRLRHALDDEDGSLLRVVHGYGYRLAVQAERLDQRPSGPAAELPARVGPTAAPFWRSALGPLLVLVLVMAAFVRLPAASSANMVQAAASPESIAVLPFADLSPKRDQGYFADGLAEELLDNLAATSRLQVAARTSSFALRDSNADARAIGRKLDVRHVLEGSVRSSADRIRVTVQLIDVRSGFHVWSHTYDRPIGELFAMQDDIVAQIMEALRIQLAPEELRAVARHGTTNPEAFRQYLLGQAVFENDESAGRRSLQAFRRAVALDPQFFEAWRALAAGLDLDTLFPDTSEEMLANKREALAIMERLIHLRPRQANLYLQRGDMLFWHWRNIPATERDLERAAQLGLRDDDDWMIKSSRMYAATGRIGQALALTAKVTAHDVLPNGWTVRAYHLLGAGRIDEARTAAQQALLREPLDDHAHYYLGLCDLLQGRPQAAMEHFNDSTHTFRLTGLAMAEYTLGNHAASELHLGRLAERYGYLAPYLVADIHAWRGENDQAFLWMQRSVDVRDASLMYLAFDPLIAPLRADPRWPGLVRQAGLEAYLLAGSEKMGKGQTDVSGSGHGSE